MNSPFLSAVVIAFNEERNLGRCLESLAGVADELVVVDSGSTDATVAIAESHGARVFTHPFEGHIEQKNWAADQARGEWLLSLDADEALSEELRQSILEWKSAQSASPLVGFRMNRLTSYCGHFVRHGGWYPDTKLRLWKTGHARWTGENPHDRLELVDASRSSGHLKGDLLHYSYHTVEDHRRQIAYFSDIAAGAYSGATWLAAPGIRHLKGAFQWTKNALIRGGWRDGKTGWTIARWSAFATLEKYRKIAHLRRLHRLLEKADRTTIKRVLVCRTDAIGDVAVTLPIAGFLKSVNPDLEVDFLTRPYAAPAARAAESVDRVVLWEDNSAPDLAGYDAAILAFPDVDVARQLEAAGVPIRVGTRRRWPFARFMNVHNAASRKSSGRHEAWHGLDLALSLHPAPGWSKAGLRVPEDEGAWHAWSRLATEPWETVAQKVQGADSWLVPGKQHVILHAGSNNSATNWSLERYLACMEALVKSGCRVLWTGTAKEGAALKDAWIPNEEVVDTTGKLTLDQLMSLIAAADGLVASSTGPLHLAAGLGTSCVGLYAQEAPMWPERWRPLGRHARWLSTRVHTPSGHLDIPLEAVLQALTNIGKASASE